MIRSRVILYLTLLVLVLFSAYFVGWRDLTIGTDSESYVDIYNQITLFGPIRWEPGFHVFVGIFKYFNFSHQYFFSFLYICSVILFYLSFINLNNEVTDRYGISYLFIFLLFLFSSSWFLSATLNGLRQGFGLALVYYSISHYFKYKTRVFSFVLFFLGCSFHKTIFILLPFLAVLFFNRIRLKTYFIFYILFFIGYALSINEKLINIFSNLAGLSLHDDISSYGFYSEWYGFNPYFTAYTALWFVLGYILLLFDKIHLYRVQSLEFSLKVYSVLGMYYFVFGFGGFSNRWGFAAWLFIPILQATIIMSSKLTEKVKFFIGAFFIFPYINYVYHLL